MTARVDEPIHSGHYIYCKIGRSTVKGCLDTGSQYNIMNPEMAHKLKLEIKPVGLGDPHRLSGADGKQLEIIGTVKFELKIAGFAFPTKAIVVHKLTESLLIGSHFFRAYSVIINFAESTFNIDELLSVCIHSQQQSKSIVRSVNRIYIPPHSIATITARTHKGFRNKTCLISEIPATQFNAFAVERILVTNRNRVVPVRILNHTPRELIIRAKQPVATVADVTGDKAIVVNIGSMPDHATPMPTNTPPYTANITAAEQIRFIGNESEREHQPQDKRPSHAELDDFLKAQKFTICADLTSQQRYDLAAVLYKHKDVFVDGISGLTGIKTPPAEIEVKDEFRNKRVYTRNYPMSAQQKAECHRQITEWRDANLVVPASARAGFNYNSPLLLVKKKQGCPRLCLDLRKINKIVCPVVVSLPHIAEIVDGVAERRARYYTAFDFRQSFMQVKLSEGSRDLLSFTDPTDGLPYSMAVAPFGFVSSGSYLASALATVLRGLETDGSLALYVDDCLISHSDYKTHLQVIAKLLTRFQKFCVKVGIGKSTFAFPKCEFLGVEFSEHGHRAIPKFSDKLAKEYKPPTNQRGVVRFLAWSGYYRRYIRSYSKRTFHLRRLTRQGVPFVFDDKCLQEFEDIKSALVSPEILTGFDKSRPIVVKTDASFLGIGIVICQYGTDGKEYTVAFHSQATSEAQAKWSSWELELYAVLCAYRKYRTILACTKSYVLTDNNAVLNFKTLEINSPKVARWLMYLSGFWIETIKISGREHVVPDCLSRLSESLTKEERAELLKQKDADIEDFILQVTASVEASKPSRFQAYDIVKDDESISTVPDSLERSATICNSKPIAAKQLSEVAPSKTVGMIARQHTVRSSTLNPHASEFVPSVRTVDNPKLRNKPQWIKNVRDKLVAVNAITRQQAAATRTRLETEPQKATSSALLPTTSTAIAAPSIALEDEAVDMSIAGADEPNITDDTFIASQSTLSSLPTIVDASGKRVELTDEHEIRVELPELNFTAELYEADREFGDIYRYITTGELSGCDTRDRKTLLMRDLFFIENGILYFIEHTRSQKLKRLKQIRPRLCIPLTHQSYVLEHFHNFLNHAPVERLYKTASETIYFHKLYEACHMLVNTCQTCILGRAKYTPLNPLNQHRIQTEFGRSWHVDFLNLTRVTPSGYKYILVCVESSCGYIEARLAKTLTIVLKQHVCWLKPLWSTMA